MDLLIKGLEIPHLRQGEQGLAEMTFSPSSLELFRTTHRTVSLKCQSKSLNDLPLKDC